MEKAHHSSFRSLRKLALCEIELFNSLPTPKFIIALPQGGCWLPDPSGSEWGWNKRLASISKRTPGSIRGRMKSVEVEVGRQWERGKRWPRKAKRAGGTQPEPAGALAEVTRTRLLGGGPFPDNNSRTHRKAVKMRDREECIFTQRNDKEEKGEGGRQGRRKGREG